MAVRRQILAEREENLQSPSSPRISGSVGFSRRPLKNGPFLAIAVLLASWGWLFVIREGKAPLGQIDKQMRSKPDAHKINPWSKWQRITPSDGGTVYGERDDFSIGKSCHRKGRRQQWICVDCGRNGTNDDCRKIKRRGKCKAIKNTQPWEEPRPRSASTYAHDASWKYPVRLISSFGIGTVRKVQYEQAQCGGVSLDPCFNISKCTEKLGNKTVVSIPMKVHVYGNHGIINDLDRSLVELVQDPSNACLLLVSYMNLRTSMRSHSWDHGRNHLVFGMEGDWPFGDVNLDMAAMATTNHQNAQIRYGYDISMPLPAQWKPPSEMEKLLEDIHRPRRLLISFKGSIQDTIQPFYQHRWIAAEYWPTNDPQVEVDVQCKHTTLRGKKVISQPYDRADDPGHFDDLMVNSTFAFCPGGSGVSSYRFTEVLSAGGIPVILPEIVPPFANEVNWDGCVVRVSEARIIDLPRMLRQISPEEVRSRQKRCYDLYRRYASTPQRQWQAVFRIWLARMRTAVVSEEIFTDSLNI